MRQGDKKQISIKWKLFLYFLLFTAVTLAAIWIFQTFLADRIYKSVKTKEIVVTANKLAESFDYEDFAEIINNTASEKQLCIVAFMVGKNDMYQVASSDVLKNCVIHRISLLNKMKLYYSAKENDGEDLQRFRFDQRSNVFYSVSGELFSKDSSIDGDESVIYTVVRETDDGYDAVLMINSVISPMGSTVKAVNMQLICISGILVLLSLVLALIISSGIAKPIITMSKKAKQLADGKYNVDFGTKGYLEISELGETLNQTEKELAATDAMRKDLIANISHDLRTPLTMINGYAEIMRDIPGENNAENVQVIIDESKRLTTLINDVLDVTRLENGAEKIKISEFDITESVGEMLDRYNALIKNEGFTIVFEHEKNIIVKQDESKLLKVIYNLVNNAVTYAGEDKTVRVVQSESLGKVKFSVYDNGDGIEAEKLRFIWDRYYKVDKEHKRASVGSGLGLSIVRTVMDMLKGSYGVLSTVGAGSCFWIEFDREYTETVEN